MSVLKSIFLMARETQHAYTCHLDISNVSYVT